MKAGTRRGYWSLKLSGDRNKNILNGLEKGVNETGSKGSLKFLLRQVFHLLYEDAQKHGDRREVKISYCPSVLEQMSLGNNKHKVFAILFKFHFPHIILKVHSCNQIKLLLPP